MKKNIEWIIRRSISCILERFEAAGGEYPFVDTKFDIVSGCDFGADSEPFRRKDCIYSWIQGRGLESLAKHAEFFASAGDLQLADRLKRMLDKVAGEMEKLRNINDGRLPFAMYPDGRSFFKQEFTAGNYSNLFYSKGLFAAGRVLGNEHYIQQGRELLLQVLESIRRSLFRTDQQSFDPKNQVAFIEGKFPQGPRMIALGGIADMLNAYPDEDLWCDYAEEFITFIFDYHINCGQYSELQMYDFVESLDSDNRIWRDEDMIFCDPGHALEFTGLAGKCLLILADRQKRMELVNRGKELLPRVFNHVFDYGFSFAAGGIVKGYDLIKRQAVNSDMPWWSLPETVRAGLQLTRLGDGGAAVMAASRAGAAFQAFTQGFLQKNGFGCQTRDAQGQIVNVIPAVPDADPGYHTNLSLLDILN